MMLPRLLLALALAGEVAPQAVPVPPGADFPTTPGLYAIASISRPEITYFLYLPKRYDPGSPSPLVITYAKNYMSSEGEVMPWIPLVEPHGIPVVAVSMGGTLEKGGQGHLSEEILERAKRTLQINPYAVLVACKGVDLVLRTVVERPDLFRYGCQQDGWGRAYPGEPEGDCETRRPLWGSCHVRMNGRHKDHVRDPTRNRFADEGPGPLGPNAYSFQGMERFYGACGFRSLETVKCGSGQVLAAETMRWFLAKLAEDEGRIRDSLAVEEASLEAGALLASGRRQAALEAAEKGLSGHPGALPQAREHRGALEALRGNLRAQVARLEDLQRRLDGCAGLPERSALLASLPGEAFSEYLAAWLDREDGIRLDPRALSPVLEPAVLRHVEEAVRLLRGPERARPGEILGRLRGYRNALRLRLPGCPDAERIVAEAEADLRNGGLPEAERRIREGLEACDRLFGKLKPCKACSQAGRGGPSDSCKGCRSRNRSLLELLKQKTDEVRGSVSSTPGLEIASEAERRLPRLGD